MPHAVSLVSLHRLVWTALLAAIIAVGAFIQFPLGPIPFSMQTFFILLAGFILGPMQGAAAVWLYLAAGLLGLPVFAGGASGFAHLVGPTGGFLIGFVPCAALAGMASRKSGEPLSWTAGLLWGLSGTLVLYAIGVPWLKFKLAADWKSAFLIGFVPFFPGGMIKIVAAVACARFLQKRRLAP